MAHSCSIIFDRGDPTCDTPLSLQQSLDLAALRRFALEGVASLAPPLRLPMAGSDFGLGGEDVAGGPRLHVLVPHADGAVHDWRTVSSVLDGPRAVPSLLLASPRHSSSLP